MAADSATFIGSLRFRVAQSKIRRRPTDGALIGGAGTSPIIQTYVEWFMKHEHHDAKPEDMRDIEEDDLSCLIAMPDGRIFHVGRTLRPYEVLPPYAIGAETSVHLALGAMHAGASAEQAVEIAVEHSNYVGGPVQVERLAR